MLFQSDSATYRAARTARAIGFGLMPFLLVMWSVPVRALLGSRQRAWDGGDIFAMLVAVFLTANVVALPIAAQIAASRRVLALWMMVVTGTLIALIAWLALFLDVLTMVAAFSSSAGHLFRILCDFLIALGPTLLIVQSIRALVDDHIREPVDSLDARRDTMIGWAIARIGLLTAIVFGAATLAWARSTDRVVPAPVFEATLAAPWDGDARPRDALTLGERKPLLDDIRRRGAPAPLADAYDESLRDIAWELWRLESSSITPRKSRPLSPDVLANIAQQTRLDELKGYGGQPVISLTAPLGGLGSLTFPDLTSSRQDAVGRGEIERIAEGLILQNAPYNEDGSAATSPWRIVPTYLRLESRLKALPAGAWKRLTQGQVQTILQQARQPLRVDSILYAQDSPLPDRPVISVQTFDTDGSVRMKVDEVELVLTPDGTRAPVFPSEALKQARDGGTLRYARASAWPARMTLVTALLGIAPAGILIWRMSRVAPDRRRWIKINLAIGVICVVCVAVALFDLRLHDVAARRWMHSFMGAAFLALVGSLVLVEWAVLAATMSPMMQRASTEIIGPRSHKRDRADAGRLQ